MLAYMLAYMLACLMLYWYHVKECQIKFTLDFPPGNGAGIRRPLTDWVWLNEVRSEDPGIPLNVVEYPGISWNIRNTPTPLWPKSVDPWARVFRPFRGIRFTLSPLPPSPVDPSADPCKLTRKNTCFLQTHAFHTGPEGVPPGVTLGYFGLLWMKTPNMR